LIQQSLKKVPKVLLKAFWTPFRRFGLIRTPQEERIHLLKHAKVSTVRETTYTMGLKRALRAVLALDSRTTSLEVVFQDGTSAELDLLITESPDSFDASADIVDDEHTVKTLLLINDKYLSFDDSHNAASCSLSTEVVAGNITVDSFSCLHIIIELYEMILAELSGVGNSGGNSQLRLLVSEKITQMPINIEVLQTELEGELEVRWMDPEIEKDLKVFKLDRIGEVTLHNEWTCGSMISDELIALCKSCIGSVLR
jgi:hypothetical protein